MGFIGRTGGTTTICPLTGLPYDEDSFAASVVAGVQLDDRRPFWHTDSPYTERTYAPIAIGDLTQMTYINPAAFSGSNRTRWPKVARYNVRRMSERGRRIDSSEVPQVWRLRSEGSWTSPHILPTHQLFSTSTALIGGRV